MLALLATYLYQHKKLVLPGIGNFEVVPQNATASYDSVEAPGWTLHFSENDTASSAENPEGLYYFLSTKEALTKEEALEQFEEFARNLVVKLNDKEVVHWETVGILEKPDERIAFTPAIQTGALFTSVPAQKVIRDHTVTSHPVLVGEKETSSDAIRASTLPETESGNNNKVLWIVVTIAVIAAAAFFLKNGCSVSSAGSREKVEVQKTPETYKLK